MPNASRCRRCLLGWSLLGLLVLAGNGLTGETALSAAEPLESLLRKLESPQPAQRVQAIQDLSDLPGQDADVDRALGKVLSDANLTVRIEALMALEKRETSAQNVLPQVLRALQGAPESEAAFRVEALHFVGQFGTPQNGVDAVVAKFLTSKNSHEQMTAAWALAKLLPRTHASVQQAIPVAIRGLEDSQVVVQNAAISALAEIGEPAVVPLQKVLQPTTAPALLERAAAALALIGPAAALAVPELTKLLSHREERVVMQSVRTLGSIGPQAKSAVPELLKLLTSAKESRRLQLHVVTTLGEMGPDSAAAVPQLIQLLSHDDEAIRRVAAKSLGFIGPAAKSAVPKLIAALHDKAGSVTLHAAEALGRMGPDAAPELIAGLKDEKLRHWAAIILGDIGPAAKMAVPDLIKALQDPRPDIRREAVIALAHIGPEAQPAVPALLKLLNSSEMLDPRGGAAYALGKIGAKEAIPDLHKTLQNKDDQNLRIASAWALVMLEPDNKQILTDAVPQLLLAAKHPWVLARREAMTALGKIGSGAKAAVPTLTEALSDTDAGVRNEALVALAEIGPDAAPAVPKIVERLADSQINVRYSACFALGRIGPAAREAAVPALLKTLQDPDDFLKMMSAWALVHISPRTENISRLASPLIVLALKHPQPRVRAAALRATQKLSPPPGPLGKLLHDAIETATRDENEEVRQAATEALAAMKK